MPIAGAVTIMEIRIASGMSENLTKTGCRSHRCAAGPVSRPFVRAFRWPEYMDSAKHGVLAASLIGPISVATTHGGEGVANRTPNIIFIMADYLGYGDLSCYGATKFSTSQVAKARVRTRSADSCSGRQLIQD